MKTHTVRFQSGQDLRKELELFVKSKDIQAGTMVTCVGSLKKAVLRMAGAKADNQVVNDYAGPLEIVSLVGTLGQAGMHLHGSFSDKEGKVVGGHVKEGCIIETTAEVVVGELEDIIFKRELDVNTGFEELKVEKK